MPLCSRISRRYCSNSPCICSIDRVRTSIFTPKSVRISAGAGFAWPWALADAAANRTAQTAGTNELSGLSMIGRMGAPLFPTNGRTVEVHAIIFEVLRGDLILAHSGNSRWISKAKQPLGSNHRYSLPRRKDAQVTHESQEQLL